MNDELPPGLVADELAADKADANRIFNTFRMLGFVIGTPAALALLIAIDPGIARDLRSKFAAALNGGCPVHSTDCGSDSETAELPAAYEDVVTTPYVDALPDAWEETRDVIDPDGDSSGTADIGSEE